MEGQDNRKNGNLKKKIEQDICENKAHWVTVTSACSLGLSIC